MAVIRIEEVEFENPPAEPVEVTIKHRLTSLPDIEGNWITDTVNAVVQPDGLFVPPFYVEGLFFNISYMVKIIMNCDPTQFVVEEVLTPNLCPDVAAINGTTGGGNPEDQFL